jgi:hypothetical protein
MVSFHGADVLVGDDEPTLTPVDKAILWVIGSTAASVAAVLAFTLWYFSSG